VEARPAILVVDDDQSWQMLYREVFEEEGYLVHVAPSETMACRVLDERPFEVAIVDLRLVDDDPQNQDGLQVVKHLRDLRAPTRVIVKSGYLTDRVRRHLKAIGVFAILDKDGPVRELIDAVAHATEPTGDESEARSGRKAG
jgi:DNA-binding NtrC family response regulator